MNENTIKWHLVEAKKNLAKSVNNYKYKWQYEKERLR
jgi:hypothetical protein